MKHQVPIIVFHKSDPIGVSYEPQKHPSEIQCLCRYNMEFFRRYCKKNTWCILESLLLIATYWLVFFFFFLQSKHLSRIFDNTRDFFSTKTYGMKNHILNIKIKKWGKINHNYLLLKITYITIENDIILSLSKLLNFCTRRLAGVKIIHHISSITS